MLRVRAGPHGKPNANANGLPDLMMSDFALGVGQGRESSGLHLHLNGLHALGQDAVVSPRPPQKIFYIKIDSPN